MELDKIAGSDAVTRLLGNRDARAPRSAPRTSSRNEPKPPHSSMVDRRFDWSNTLFIGLAHLLALAGVLYLAFVRFEWWTVGLGFLWFAFCGLGITGGYHRLFAHPTYKRFVAAARVLPFVRCSVGPELGAEVVRPTIVSAPLARPTLRLRSLRHQPRLLVGPHRLGAATRRSPTARVGHEHGQGSRSAIR